MDANEMFTPRELETLYHATGSCSAEWYQEILRLQRQKRRAGRATDIKNAEAQWKEVGAVYSKVARLLAKERDQLKESEQHGR